MRDLRLDEIKVASVEHKVEKIGLRFCCGAVVVLIRK